MKKKIKEVIKMRFVWVSRHELTDLNKQILKKAFGDFDVVQFKDTVQDIKDLKQFADQRGADAYIVVLPPHLIQQLLAIDKRPIYRFIVERKVNEQGDVTFTPIGLERIKEIKVVTERIV